MAGGGARGFRVVRGGAERDQWDHPSVKERMAWHVALGSVGLVRGEHLMRVCELRRIRQRQRAQALVCRTLQTPKRGQWGKRSLGGSFGTFGVPFFVDGATVVKDRHIMGTMVHSTIGKLFTDAGSIDACAWIWGEFSADDAPVLTASDIASVLCLMSKGKTCSEDRIVAEMLQQLPEVALTSWHLVQRILLNKANDPATDCDV